MSGIRKPPWGYLLFCAFLYGPEYLNTFGSMGLSNVQKVPNKYFPTALGKEIIAAGLSDMQYK